MISSKNIRFHAPSNTYIIPKNSVIDQNITISGNAIVGTGVHFWKNVKIDGNVQIGKGCIIEGNLKAGKIIVGSRSKIKGNILAESDVSLFQNTSVQSIESGGNITIMQNCTVGYANGETLEIVGKAEVGKIGSITKMTVRAEFVNELEPENEDEEINGNEEISEDKDIENEIKISEEESNFENKNIDVEESTPIETQTIENGLMLNASLNSSATPMLQMENDIEKPKSDIKADEKVESSDAEIIDMEDESSPKSFSESFERSSVQPINVSADEIEEVEIIENEIAENSNAANKSASSKNLKTVETPFGTIVIGEQDSNDTGKQNENKKEQFASVIHTSKEEQQADYEAELKSKFGKPASSSPISKSETGLKTESKIESKTESRIEPKKEAPLKAEKSRWPAFEPQNIKSETKQIQYEEIKDRESFKAKENPTASIKQPESVKQTEAAKQAEIFKQSNFSKANQKIVFEEIPSGKPNEKLNPVQEYSSQKQGESQKRNEKQNEKQSEKQSEEQSEKQKQAQLEAEKSKAWYEERYQSAPQKKKEYPPYI